KALADALRGANKLYGKPRGLQQELEDIPVVYYGRLGRRAGLAIAGRVHGKYIPYAIQINSQIPMASAMLHTTLVHEFCHAIRWIVADDEAYEPGHGKEWKRLMVASGQEPDEYVTD